MFRILKNLLPDDVFLKIKYRRKMNKNLNLSNPKTFTEKLQWLKIYDRKPIYATMVDKYEAKKYVADIIGKENLISTLNVWNHFDEIDFDTLPDSFVLKCTHDSGGVVIVKDKSKLDKNAVKKKMEDSLASNFYYVAREWPYKNVKPRIMAEEYIASETDGNLSDYKFYCFNGIPKYCQVIKDRNINQTVDFFDMEWNHQMFTGMQKPFKPHSTTRIEKPITFDKMKEFAKVLAKDIPFVRVDFYEVEGKLYFGELTFYPAAGFGGFEPGEWDDKLGELLDLSSVKI